MDEESPSGDSVFDNNVEGKEMIRRMVLIGTVILFLTGLFVLLLHLYAKFFCWRFQRYLHQQSQSESGSIIAVHQRRRFVSSGLDHSVLQSIPVVVFNQQDFKDGLECAVCLSELADGEETRLLPICNHGFHVECIDTWFRSHSTCPLCRNMVGSVGETSDEVLSPLSQTSESGISTETPNFPTNVLIWGDQNQVNSVSISVVEDNDEADSSNDHRSETTSTNRSENGIAVVVEIPANANENFSATPSASFVEEESKSPLFTRLRSLKRLLSYREKTVAVSSSSSGSSNV